MVVSSYGWEGLGRLIYFDVFSVPFLECFPKRAFGTSVPCVIKCFH